MSITPNEEKERVSKREKKGKGEKEKEAEKETSYIRQQEV